MAVSKDIVRWSSIFVTFTLKKIIDWNISFQTVSCIHLMNVDVYDCNRDCFKFCVKSKN